jgi:hypothetical protein
MPDENGKFRQVHFRNQNIVEKIVANFAWVIHLRNQRTDAQKFYPMDKLWQKIIRFHDVPLDTYNSSYRSHEWSAGFMLGCSQMNEKNDQKEDNNENNDENNADDQDFSFAK